MKLTKDPIKNSRINTERKKLFMNKSVEDLKISDYSTIQGEEDSFIYEAALEEYNDLFPEILILSKNEFFTTLEKYIQINLATSSKIITPEAINKSIYLIEKKLYNDENRKINRKLKLNNLANSSFKYTDKNFIPHCKQTTEAIHSCGEKLNAISNKYYYCVKCNLIYKSDYILLKCDKCNVDYYTEIENKNKISEKDEYLKPATWVKYHCNALISDTMRCSKCQNSLYLNIKNNLLYCIKCNTQMSQTDIKWKCILCKQIFTSEAKIFNRYEYKIMSLAIKKAIFKGVEAKPKYLPCCHVYGEKIKSYKFYHKNECSGLLYEGELDNKKIVVCSKCHMLNFRENQYWLCPICKVRFQIQMKNNISLFDSSKITNEKKEKNQQIYQDRETFNNKEIYKKKRQNNLSIELKKNIFNLNEKEKEKQKEDNEKKEKEKEKERASVIESKKEKIFSSKNKPKKSDNKYYNNFVNINIKDHSHKIFSNYKRSQSNNDINLRFQTI